MALQERSCFYDGRKRSQCGPTQKPGQGAADLARTSVFCRFDRALHRRCLEDYEVDLVEVPGGEKVDERIYDPLMEMLDAAEAEDLGPIVVSGFRTEEKQQTAGLLPGGGR